MSGYVKRNDIRNDAVVGRHIKDGEVSAGKLASDAITTAKIADSAVTSAKIADGSVTIDKVEQKILREASVTIPAGNGAGNAGDLNTTPVPLVAAPGAGLYIHVDSVHWFLDYGSAAYDGTKTGNLMVKYTDGSGDELAGQVAETGFIDQTADTHAVVHGVAYVPLANAAVVAHSSNDWFSAAGDSPVKARVIYRVLPIDPTT